MNVSLDQEVHRHIATLIPLRHGKEEDKEEENKEEKEGEGEAWTSSYTRNELFAGSSLPAETKALGMDQLMDRRTN